MEEILRGHLVKEQIRGENKSFEEQVKFDLQNKSIQHQVHQDPSRASKPQDTNLMVVPIYLCSKFTESIISIPADWHCENCEIAMEQIVPILPVASSSC